MIPGMLPKICHLAAYKNEGLESNLAIPDARPLGKGPGQARSAWREIYRDLSIVKVK
jgi:hypothetical protein